MDSESNKKIVPLILGGILVILLVILAVLPFLNRMFAVSVAKEEPPVKRSAEVPEPPETVPVTVYYIMEENSKKISAVYIEVLQGAAGTVSYVEIPVDTQVDLSEELYKSLQTYGPELPQHLKLANVAESFSAEYGLTAANRVLSVITEVSLTEYVRTTAEAFQRWLEFSKEQKKASVFFEEYSEWIAGTTSSRTVKERWSYYETRRQVTGVNIETAPGSREKDGYRISSKRLGECLNRLMQETNNATETEE